jgi:hypothetical protein
MALVSLSKKKYLRLHSTAKNSITIGIFLILWLSRKRGAGDESEDSLEWLNPSPVKSPRLTITTTTITSREEEEQVGVP